MGVMEKHMSYNETSTHSKDTNGPVRSFRGASDPKAIFGSYGLVRKRLISPRRCTVK